MKTAGKIFEMLIALLVMAQCGPTLFAGIRHLLKGERELAYLWFVLSSVCMLVWISYCIASRTEDKLEKP